MTSWRDSITVHPLADSFPMMSDGELKELAEDIRQNGQREPAVFVEIDGVRTLIDGRHRLEACAMIGREAWTTTATKLKDDAAIRAFIISHNVHRRHLTPEERQKRLEAAIVADPTASARAIGEKVGVDKNKVVKARKKLESTGAVSPVKKTVGKDDICAEDGARETVGIEKLDDNDIPDEVESWVRHLRDHAQRQHTPIGFWDDLDVYVEVAVEKLDLRNLFEPVCAEFHIPVTNFKGWSDLNSRAAMMRRFMRHEEEGQSGVLLLCGDHDPGGLHITATMRKNLEDLSGAVDWNPGNLEIIRFGLNADFIDAHDLTWIDNLETSSGGQLDDPGHNDHAKQYVQNYIAQFGARKCEANALVVEPDVGRQLWPQRHP
jgi:ParB-like chromosome segregation protein Spo0J